MTDYFTARRKRYLRNEYAMVALACKVKRLDPSIDVYHNGMSKIITSLVFFRGEEYNSVGFHDVPYRWSGCGYDEIYQFGSHPGINGHELPFTAEDVLRTFTSPPRIHYYNDTSRQSFLRWYSFYSKLDVESTLASLTFKRLNPEE